MKRKDANNPTGHTTERGNTSRETGEVAGAPRDCDDVIVRYGKDEPDLSPEEMEEICRGKMTDSGSVDSIPSLAGASGVAHSSPVVNTSESAQAHSQEKASSDAVRPESCHGGAGQTEACAVSSGSRWKLGLWLPVRMIVVLFLSVVTIAFGAVFGVTLYRTYFAVASEIEVPAIQGKDLVKANSILSKAGLRLTVDEGHYSNKFPDRVVISQEPAPGKTVRRDREVLAVVSLGPEKVTIPDLKGKSVREVGMMLNNSHLKLGKVSKIKADRNRPDEIVGQHPAAGALVRTGSTVNVDVNEGFGVATVAVPDWTGKSISNAKPLLDKVGLTLGRVSWTFSDDIPRGRIIQQSPPSGSSVVSGSEVSFVVSGGKASANSFVQRHLELFLPAGSDQHSVRIVIVTGAAEETVYEASHVVGDKIDTWVSGPADSDIEIYVNNKLFGRDKL